MAGRDRRNYMDELCDIICAIENAKPEPEPCNARCPPLGCPKGPCIGTCCYQDTCDACCVSQMLTYRPPPVHRHCYAPPCSSIRRARQRCANPCPFTATRPSPPIVCRADRGAAAPRCLPPRPYNT